MAKKLMFQGTGSTVGKSITVAAMCKRDGESTSRSS